MDFVDKKILLIAKLHLQKSPIFKEMKQFVGRSANCDVNFSRK